MGPQERRSKILEHLCAVRHDKVESLAERFHVSEKTIRNDITALSCEYPIETYRGRYSGGIRVLDGFRLDRKTLTSKQVQLLRKLQADLTGEDIAVMQSILSQFAPHGGY